MPGSSPNSVATDARVTLRYSFEGLSARDALLLKSLVRLLSHRTQHQWSFDPEQAQLHVLGDELPPEPASKPMPGDYAPVLHLSHAQQGSDHFLHLPLHADELERMLNRLGLLILQTKVLRVTAAETSGLDHEEYQLRRWPPAALLGTPKRLKLATLMTGRTLSLAALQQRSLQAPQDCAEFFLDLKHAGLLQHIPPANTHLAPDSLLPRQAPTARTKAPSGLLARIRSRLGLHSAEPT